MAEMFAAIPYTTFPQIELGPITLRTFGLMVALAVVAGTTIASRWGERWGIARERTTSLATRLVIAGIVGSRLSWAITHMDEIDSPIDIIAVWNGGLQFSGGFILAVVIGLPAVRSFEQKQRWRFLDGVALALTVGAAIGRIGCYAVGEHLGSPTSFPLASRYDGGETREGPLVVGEAIHNTSLYEFVSLVVLGMVLTWLLYRRKAGAGAALGIFLIWYSAARFSTDFLRSYDELTFGLTGAQWMCLVLLPVGLWIFFRTRPGLARISAPESVDQQTSDSPESDGLTTKDVSDSSDEADASPTSSDGPESNSLAQEHES